jgi:hypothetical protein
MLPEQLYTQICRVRGKNRGVRWGRSEGGWRGRERGRQGRGRGRVRGRGRHEQGQGRRRGGHQPVRAS